MTEQLKKVIREWKTSPNEKRVNIEFFKQNTGYNESVPVKSIEYKYIGVKKYKWNGQKSKWIRQMGGN